MMAHHFSPDQVKQSIAAFIEEGSTQALAIVYDIYASALMGVIKSMVSDPDISSDILQQTFIEMWKTRTTYDPSRERPFIWMMKIARRVAMEAIGSGQQISNTKNQEANNSVYPLGIDINQDQQVNLTSDK